MLLLLIPHALHGESYGCKNVDPALAEEEELQEQLETLLMTSDEDD